MKLFGRCGGTGANRHWQRQSSSQTEGDAVGRGDGGSTRSRRDHLSSVASSLSPRFHNWPSLPPLYYIVALRRFSLSYHGPLISFGICTSFSTIFLLPRLYISLGFVIVQSRVPLPRLTSTTTYVAASFPSALFLCRPQHLSLPYTHCLCIQISHGSLSFTLSLLNARRVLQTANKTARMLVLYVLSYLWTDTYTNTLAAITWGRKLCVWRRSGTLFGNHKTEATNNAIERFAPHSPPPLLRHKLPSGIVHISLSMGFRYVYIMEVKGVSVTKLPGLTVK